jgi:hypothetical protein
MTDLLNIAILLTAIASLATAIITYLSVKEIKISRQISSSPSIVMTGKNWITTFNEDTIFPPTDKHPDIEAVNFGNGPAINVESNWNINNQKIIDILKKYDPHNTHNIGIRKTQFVDEEVIKLFANHFFLRQINYKLNPILQYHLQKKFSVQIPPYYIESFQLYLHLAVHTRTDKKTYFDLEPFPQASFTLSYSDLAGEKNIETYNVELCYSHNGTHQLNSTNAYACFLNIKKSQI